MTARTIQIQKETMLAQIKRLLMLVPGVIAQIPAKTLTSSTVLALSAVGILSVVWGGL